MSLFSSSFSPGKVAEIPLIDRKTLLIGPCLGSGAFGDVHLGFKDGGDEEEKDENKVAIKSLRSVENQPEGSICQTQLSP